MIKLAIVTKNSMNELFLWSVLQFKWFIKTSFVNLVKITKWKLQEQKVIWYFIWFRLANIFISARAVKGSEHFVLKNSLEIKNKKMKKLAIIRLTLEIKGDKFAIKERGIINKGELLSGVKNSFGKKARSHKYVKHHHERTLHSRARIQCGFSWEIRISPYRAETRK